MMSTTEIIDTDSELETSAQSIDTGVVCEPVDTFRQTEMLAFDNCSRGLGIKIIGGCSLDGEDVFGIFVKRVLPRGLAEIRGTLRPGDQLLEVNGNSLEGVTNERAIAVLRQAASTNRVEMVMSRDEQARLEFMEVMKGNQVHSFTCTPVPTEAGSSKASSRSTTPSIADVSNGSMSPRSDTSFHSPYSLKPEELFDSKDTSEANGEHSGEMGLLGRSVGSLNSPAPPDYATHVSAHFASHFPPDMVSTPNENGIVPMLQRIHKIKENFDTSTPAKSSSSVLQETSAEQSNKYSLNDIQFSVGTNDTKSPNVIVNDFTSSSVETSGNASLGTTSSKRSSNTSLGSTTNTSSNMSAGTTTNKGSSNMSTAATTTRFSSSFPAITPTDEGCSPFLLVSNGDQSTKLTLSDFDPSNTSSNIITQTPKSSLNHDFPWKQRLTNGTSPPEYKTAINTITNLPMHRQGSPCIRTGNSGLSFVPLASVYDPAAIQVHSISQSSPMTNGPSSPPQPLLFGQSAHLLKNTPKLCNMAQAQKLEFDPSVRLNVDKLERGLQSLGLEPSPEQQSELHSKLTVDDSGTVSYGDFVNAAREVFRPELEDGSLSPGAKLFSSNNFMANLDSPPIKHEAVSTIPNVSVFEDLESIRQERDHLRTELYRLRGVLGEKERLCSVAEEEILRIRKDAQGAITETRSLRSKMHLAEQAQHAARSMEQDYEDVVKMLEMEICQLKAQLSQGNTQENPEWQKRLAVLTCQLKKSDMTKRTYEVATEKLLSFVEHVHETLRSYENGFTARSDFNSVNSARGDEPPDYLIKHKKLSPAKSLAVEAREIVKAVKSLTDSRCLPYGWEEAYTADGMKYFINHLTQTTTWSHPISQIQHLPSSHEGDKQNGITVEVHKQNGIST